MDDGPQLIASALRDSRRLAGTITTYIEPGSPRENPFVESFNGRVGDERAQGSSSSVPCSKPEVVVVQNVTRGVQGPAVPPAGPRQRGIARQDRI